jgi:ArsR family transcriptional regulator, lead/cadmium/zinc/bismuth-responsive transcriptional repressor
VSTQVDDPSRGFAPSLALLKVLADATRWRIVWALTDGELPVSSLAELAGAHVAAVSQHLAKLREAGVVTSRRDGTRIFYRLASDQVRVLLDQVVLTTVRLEVHVRGDDDRPAAGPARQRPLARVPLAEFRAATS